MRAGTEDELQGRWQIDIAMLIVLAPELQIRQTQQIACAMPKMIWVWVEGPTKDEEADWHADAEL